MGGGGEYWLLRLGRLLSRGECVGLFFGSVCMMVTSWTNSIIPALAGISIDHCLSQQHQALSRHSKKCLIIFTIGAACSFLRTYLFSHVKSNLVAKIRQKIYKNTLNKPIQFHQKKTPTYITNVMYQDVSLITDTAFTNLANLFRYTNSAIRMPITLYAISPTLTLKTLTMVPLIGVSIMLFGLKKSKTQRNLTQEELNVIEIAHERIAQIRTVKSAAAEDREVNIFKSKLAHVKSHLQALARDEASLFAWIGLAINFTLNFVMVNGAKQVANGSISVGDLTSFLLYAGFVGAGWSGLAQVTSAIRKAKEPAQRVFELLDDQPHDDKNKLVAVRDEVPSSSINETSPLVEFENVHFSYEGEEEDGAVLRGVSFSVNRGEMVALVGRSGSGKSTVASLLSGMYVPGSGRVRIRGCEASRIDPSWLAKNVALVYQESPLFNDTIDYNVRYLNPEATRDQVEAALEMAQCADFVREGIGGLDRVVGSMGSGSTLSAGQRQRLCMARALLLVGADFYVFDEATSALDGNTEESLLQGLNLRDRGAGVLMVAHREAAIRAADRVIVLENGKIVAQGKFNDLEPNTPGTPLYKVLNMEQ